MRNPMRNPMGILTGILSYFPSSHLWDVSKESDHQILQIICIRNIQVGIWVIDCFFLFLNKRISHSRSLTTVKTKWKCLRKKPYVLCFYAAEILNVHSVNTETCSGSLALTVRVAQYSTTAGQGQQFENAPIRAGFSWSKNINDCQEK